MVWTGLGVKVVSPCVCTEERSRLRVGFKLNDEINLPLGSLDGQRLNRETCGASLIAIAQWECPRSDS